MDKPVEDFDAAVYWERRLGDVNLAAVGYQGLGLAYNRWLYRLRSVLFRRTANRVRLSWYGRSVLDVGSGTGFYVAEWLRLRASVTGSDLTRSSVAELERLFPLETFVRLDIADPPPFPPESFDAVSAFDVLFHIVDDDRYRAALRNISGILKDGGLFFFTENFLRGETVRREHIVSRPLGDISRMLESEGFEVLLRRPMFVLMNVPVASKNRLLWAYWSTLEKVLSRFPGLGGALGAVLFPLEVLLVALRRNGGPSTEIAVCRKRET